MAIIRDRETEPGNNGYEPPYESQDGEQDPRPGLPDFDIIIGAPDFSALIKRPQSASAKEYTGKVAASFKALTLGAIQAGNFPDAATMLWHGPGAATALGTLCDDNKRVGDIVDMLTTPSSPWSACILAVIPLVAQLMRNHEKELREVPSRVRMGRQARQARRAAKEARELPPPRFTIKFGKRSIPVRLKMRVPFVSTFFSGVRAQTQEPNYIAGQVFLDPDVRKALGKLGVTFREVGDDGAG